MALQVVEGLALCIPSTVHVAKRPDGPDFWVYDFQIEGRTVLGMYVGNHADFGDRGPPNAMFADVSARCVGANAQSQDCLVQLLGPFPSELHFWFKNLQATDLDTAKAIIGSVSLNGTPPKN